MAELNFTDPLLLFTDLEREYADCILAGADNEEIHARFGEDAFTLKGNKELNTAIHSVKLKRKLRKHLADRAYIEEYVKLIPNAIKIMNNSMAPNNNVTATQRDAAKFVLSSVNAYLRKLFENVANVEVGVTEDGKSHLVIELSNGNTIQAI